MKRIHHLAFYLAIAALLSCTSNNTNSWQKLFNGENLDGWIVKINHHDINDNYANTFSVKDGLIQVNYDNYSDFGERFGHLYYNESFSSFHLKLEYRFTDQWMEDAPTYAYRNSGVMFHSQHPNTILKDQLWPISVEFQFLAEEFDSIPRPTGNVCTPGTDVFFAGSLAPVHCVQSSSKTYKWNEWVKSELIVYGDSIIKHVINGDTVLQYTQPQIGGNAVQGCDPNLLIDGKALREGYIALQSEGHGVEFRNIMLKKLD